MKWWGCGSTATSGGIHLPKNSGISTRTYILVGMKKAENPTDDVWYVCPAVFLLPWHMDSLIDELQIAELGSHLSPWRALFNASSAWE